MASATIRDLRTRRFVARFVSESLVAFGAIAATAGLVAALFPDALKDRGAFWVIVVVAVSVGFGLQRSWPRPIERVYTKPNTAIRLIRGDLFDEPGHIVVGACDTFDTQVPNVISSRSVQGQALQHFYGGDLARLDQDLNAALEGESSVGSVQKEGKTERYPIGTVAAVPHGPRRTLYLAYTEINHPNKTNKTSRWDLKKHALSFGRASFRCIAMASLLRSLLCAWRPAGPISRSFQRTTRSGSSHSFPLASPEKKSATNFGSSSNRGLRAA